MSTQSDERLQFAIPVRERLKFISLFTIASTLAWSIGTPLMRYLTIPITGTFFDGGLVQGVFIGIAQWAILRSYFPVKFWVLATTLGWAISQAVYGKSLLLSGVGANILGAVGFICLGLAQWSILRRQFSKYSWSWIFIYILPVALFNLVPSLWTIAGVVRNIVLWGVASACLCLFRRKNY